MKYLYVLIYVITFFAFPLNGQNAQTSSTYLDSLNDLSRKEADLENYSEAIRINLEALSYCKKNIGKKNLSYVRFLNNLASCYYDSGNYKDAINVYEKVLKIEREVLDESHPDYAISLDNLASCYYDVGDYAEAINLYEKGAKIEKQVLGEYHSDYAISLSNIASCYYEIGDYEETISLLEKVLEIEGKVLGESHPDYAISLNNLASCYYTIGDYEEAVNLYEKESKIEKHILGESHPNYVMSLSNIASCYYYLGNYEEAIKFQKKVLEIRGDVLDCEHIDYAETLNNLGANYYELGDYEEAVKVLKEAMETMEHIGGNAPSDYATSLSHLGMCYYYLGNYEEAIKFHKEALEIKEDVLGNEHPAHTASLNGLVLCYCEIGDYEEAVKLIKKALEVTKLGNEHFYAVSLHNLGMCHYYLSNYEEAIQLFQEALGIYAQTIGNQHTDYAVALNGLGVCYSCIGNYEKSFKLAKEALGIVEQALGTTHPMYARLLANLATCYHHIGNHEEDLKLIKEALVIVEQALGTTHPVYTEFLRNLAAYHMHGSGNYEEAIRLIEEVLNIEVQLLGTTHPKYISSLHDLAFCYYNLSNYEKTIQLYQESLNITEEESAICNALEGLLFCYNQIQSDELYAVWQKLYEKKISQIRCHFGKLNSSLRLSFWSTKEDYFKWIVPSFSYRYGRTEMIQTMYDAALISKGIILDTEIEFSKLIAESKDEEALRIYKELQHTRTFLNKQYEKLVSERVVNTDSLETVAEELEEQLIERSQVYGDFTRNLSIDWKQVQKKLGKDDIAIEFVSFSVSKDSTMYCALTLKKGYDAPKLIPLFEEHQLDSVNRAKCYESTAITELVWKPLDEELKETKNIYFAPDGELYNIAIESLPYNDGEGYVFDRWNLHRLSSTRELAKIKNPQLSAKAVLYGGLRYNTDVTMLKDSRQESDELYASHYRSIPDSIGLRGTYKYLPGTLYEIEGIEALYSNRNIPSIVYKDILGSETSVKKLDGQKITNLHIATHGFYWTESELNKKEDLRQLSFIGDNDRPRYVEDKAMTRSGLLFAGANHVLSGKSVPEGYDDGILTAKEISTLDLRGLDLLVLSACQTGLGEIKGDGVYGLQRGFKMAGAQTIVMSLWKVDDDATQMLMTEFYKRYLSSQSKHDAFLAAQEVVRNFKGKIRGKDKNFSDPKYWAGFVMLDAMD